MVICRLCFLAVEDFIDIFSTNDETLSHSEIVLIVNKYLDIELKPGDPVSTCICRGCWTKLWDFHQFCRIIIDKQKELLFKANEPEWIETYAAPAPAPTQRDALASESSILEECETMVDLKDFTLCKRDIGENQADTNTERYYNDDMSAADTLSDIKLKTKQKLAKASKSNQIKQTVVKKRQSTKRTIKAKMESSPLPSSSPSLPLPPSPKSPPSMRTRSLRIRLRPIDSSCLPTIKTETNRKKSNKRATKDEVEIDQPKQKSQDDFVKRMLKSSELDKYINDNVKLECAICLIPLSNFGELKRHFRSEHKCIGYVVCCNNRFKKRSIFVDHLIVHKDPDYFNCKPCNKKFVSRNCLRSHDLRYHSEEKTHQCNLCAKCFAKPFLLKQHMNVHQKNRERTEQCEHCSKSFRMPHELKAHIRRMHDANNAPIICDICGANFRTKQNFIIHRSTMHQEGAQLPEAQCPVCKRWLRNQNSLRKHMYFHREPEQPNAFKCNECGALKSSRHKLLFHKRYHHSKRHKCTLCDKEFKQTVTLTEHMATHTGIDLYSCSFCTRTFKSHANMHNHKKKMHPDQWVRKYTKPSTSQSIDEEDTLLQDTREVVVTGLQV